MAPFVISRQPNLTVGAGCLADLPRRLVKCGYREVVVITGGRSVRGREQWGGLVDELLSQEIDFREATVRGEPSPAVVDQIISMVERELPSCAAVVAIGGGSVLDTAKAVAAVVAITRDGGEAGVTHYLEGVGDRTHDGRTLPLFAVPTTAGTGSEATKNAVLSEVGPHGFKKSLRHESFVPAEVFLDAELMVGCPLEVTRAGV